MKDSRIEDDLLDSIASATRGASLVTRVSDQIERVIRERQLRVGEQLPSESELCKQFGVSRTVVREALARLSAKGLLEVRGAGGGTVVRTPTVEHLSDSLRYLLQPAVDPEHHDNVLEVRRLLEVEIAGLAAARRSEADIAKLTAILAETVVDRMDRERFAQLDVAFHTALAAATHNPLFVVLLDSLGGVLLPLRRLGYSTPGNPERAIRYHEAILEEVRLGSVPAARHAMQAHLVEAEDTMRMVSALSEHEQRVAMAEIRGAQPLDTEPIHPALNSEARNPQ